MLPEFSQLSSVTCGRVDSLAHTNNLPLLTFCAMYKSMHQLVLLYGIRYKRAMYSLIRPNSNVL